MKYLILILTSILVTLSLTAQEVVTTNRNNKVTVTTFKHKTIKGIFYEVKDSSINIANQYNDYEITTVSYSQIKDIKVRKRFNILKGVLIGLVSGAVEGYGLGYMRGDDPKCTSGLECLFTITLTAEQKGGMGAAIGGLIGTGFGIWIGAPKVAIPINGSMANYNKYKKEMKKLSKFY